MTVVLLETYLYLQYSYTKNRFVRLGQSIRVWMFSDDKTKAV